MSSEQVAAGGATQHGLSESTAEGTALPGARATPRSVRHQKMLLSDKCAWHDQWQEQCVSTCALLSLACCSVCSGFLCFAQDLLKAPEGARRVRFDDKLQDLEKTRAQEKEQLGDVHGHQESPRFPRQPPDRHCRNKEDCPDECRSYTPQEFAGTALHCFGLGVLSMRHHSFYGVLQCLRCSRRNPILKHRPTSAAGLPRHDTDVQVRTPAETVSVCLSPPFSCV